MWLYLKSLTEWTLKMEMSEEEFYEGLMNFAEKLAGQQEDLPEEFREVLDKNFWELVDGVD